MVLSIDARSDYLIDEHTGKLWHYDGKRHVAASTEQYQRVARKLMLGWAGGVLSRYRIGYSHPRRCAFVEPISPEGVK